MSTKKAAAAKLTPEHVSVNKIIATWRRFVAAAKAKRISDRSEDTRLGNAFRDYVWSEPSPEVGRQAQEAATFQQGKADIWRFETESFDELGVGALLYFKLLKSLVLMFGVMSIVALPSLVFTYGGTRLSDESLPSNSLTRSTLANIRVDTTCTPSVGNTTAGNCDQKVCVLQPATTTLSGNWPAIIGSVFGVVAAAIIGSVFGEDITPCVTRSWRIIFSVVTAVLFAAVAIPVGFYFGCVGSSTCVTSTACYPAPLVFTIIQYCDIINLVIFLVFTGVFSNSITKTKQLVDDTTVTSDDYTVIVMGLPKRATKEEIRAHFSSLYQLNNPPWNAAVLERKLLCGCIRAYESGREEEWGGAAAASASAATTGDDDGDIEAGEDKKDENDNLEIAKPVRDVTHINKYARIDEPHDHDLQADYLAERKDVHGAEKADNWVAEVSIVHPNSKQVRLFMKSKANLLAIRRTRALIQRLSPGEDEVKALEDSLHHASEEDAPIALEKLETMQGITGTVTAKMCCKRQKLKKIEDRIARQKMAEKKLRIAKLKLSLKGCISGTFKIDRMELDQMIHEHDLPGEGRPYPPRTPLLAAKSVGFCKKKMTPAYDTFAVEQALEQLEHLDENTRDNQQSHEELYEIESMCCNKRPLELRPRERVDKVTLRAYVTFNNVESYERAVADFTLNYPCYNCLGFGRCVPKEMRFKSMHAGDDADSDGHILKVHGASSPGGILWENLDTPTWQVYTRKVLTTTIAICLLLASTAIIAIAKAQADGNPLPDFGFCTEGGIDSLYYGYSPPAHAPDGANLNIVRNVNDNCAAEFNATGKAHFSITYPDANVTKNLEFFARGPGSKSVCYAPSQLESCLSPCVDPLNFALKCPTQACLSASNRTGDAGYMDCASKDRLKCEFNPATVAACYCIQQLKKLPVPPSLSEFNELYEREKDLCGSLFMNIVTGQSITIGVAVFIAVLNIVLKSVMTQLSLFEHHHSLSAQSESLSLKTFISLFINTAILLLVLNWKFPKLFVGQDDLTKGDIDKFAVPWYPLVGAAVLTNMLVNLITPHIPILLLGPKRLITFGLKWTTTTIQYDMNELMKGPAWAPETRYPFVMNTVFVTMLYSGGMPLLYPLAMLYFIANYWVDKGAILRIYRMDGLDGLDGSLAKQVILHCATTLLMYSDSSVTYNDYDRRVGVVLDESWDGIYDAIHASDPFLAFGFSLRAILSRSNSFALALFGIIVLLFTLFNAVSVSVVSFISSLVLRLVRSCSPKVADVVDNLITSSENEISPPAFTGEYELAMNKKHSAYFMKEYIRKHEKHEVLVELLAHSPWLINLTNAGGGAQEGMAPTITKQSKVHIMTMFASVFGLHDAHLGRLDETEPDPLALLFVKHIEEDLAMISIYPLPLVDLRCLLVELRDRGEPDALTAEKAATKEFMERWNDELTVSSAIGETKKRNHLVEHEYVFRTWAGLTLLSHVLSMDCMPRSKLLDNDARFRTNMQRTESAEERAANRAEIKKMEQEGKAEMYVRWEQDITIDGVSHKKNERMRTWEKIRQDGAYSYNVHNNPRYKDAMRWSAEEILGWEANHYHSLAEAIMMQIKQRKQIKAIHDHEGHTPDAVAVQTEIHEIFADSTTWAENPMASPKANDATMLFSSRSIRLDESDFELPELPPVLLAELTSAFVTCDSMGRTDVDEIHLSAADVATLMAAFGSPAHDHELEALMRIVDPEGSGSVEWDELLLFIRKQHKIKNDAKEEKANLEPAAEDAVVPTAEAGVAAGKEQEEVAVTAADPPAAPAEKEAAEHDEGGVAAAAVTNEATEIPDQDEGGAAAADEAEETPDQDATASPRKPEAHHFARAEAVMLKVREEAAAKAAEVAVAAAEIESEAAASESPVVVETAVSTETVAETPIEAETEVEAVATVADDTAQ